MSVEGANADLAGGREAIDSSRPGSRDFRPTISDVARTAGVSLGTASNVISGTRFVRPETRARVEVAIAALGYRPNVVARSMMTRRTNTIGMLVPDVANPFFAEVMRGAEDAFGERGFVVTLGSSDHDPEKERRYLANFADRRVDATIIAPGGQTSIDVLAALRAHGPVVLVAETVPGWTGDSIVSDEQAGYRAIVDHLVGLGHRRIAFINGNPDLSSSGRRLAAFEAALASQGLAAFSVTQSPYTVEGGRRQALQVLSGDELPTAICAANDLLAFGVLSASRQLAIRVPYELSVVGYDDIAYAQLANPSLTTAAQGAYETGRRCAELILARLDDGQATGRTILMPAELIVRESTAAANS